MLINSALSFAIRNSKQSIEYLINDTFTTDRSAGTISDTEAEPGEGRRFVIDTNNKVSLSGGQLLFTAGGVAATDQLYYNPVKRAIGRLVIAQVGGITETFGIGFDAATASPPTAGVVAYGIRFAGGGRTLQVQNNAVPLSVGNWALTTTYQIAVIARSPGTYFLIKGGVFIGWTLLWVSNIGVQVELYPAVVIDSATAVFAVDYMRVSSLQWLPDPLLSDGFSVLSSSDGKGHNEGVAGSYGSGGNLKSYTSIGTWAISNGLINASALSGGLSFYYSSVVADVIITAKLTRSGGNVGLVLRYVDSSNYIICYHNGTNVILTKRLIAVDVVVQTTAITYVAGAELRVICVGSAFRIYYNNTLVGSEKTIADAAVQSSTNFGLYTTNTGNTIDDLTMYARGTNNEYSILDSV